MLYIQGLALGSLSDIDDLTTTFLKVSLPASVARNFKTNVTGPWHPGLGVIGNHGSGSFFTESSSAAEWSKEANFLDWFDQDFSESESYQESKRWSSQPHISVVHLAESKPLYRTSSYPQRPQQLQQFLSEPILSNKQYLTTSFSASKRVIIPSDYVPPAAATTAEIASCSSADFRPCVLLEFDPPGLVSSGEQKVFEKPLEQEPTLAARITIEDGFYLLLEVDDIDRLLQFSQPQDGGAQLRQKRQILLEGMTASLQLVDPLGKSGSSVGLTPKDDIVFLWLVSLPKGQKLISRVLFGGLPTETEAAETITNLAKIVAGCISGMDLNSLSACLAAIVYPQAGGSFSMPNPALWQTSFDAVFGLLTKYCLSKYESIIQSILAQTTSNTEMIGPEAARAVSREMHVQLLRASLPHTNEQQRKLLFNFAQ
ncbi:hypothetical protein KY284_030615 [Solanum tuberosum]|nr:hypothetical protein KY284_030615 [Solanum tuberosum]